MDRRNFIQKSAAALLASQIGAAGLLSAFPGGKKADGSAMAEEPSFSMGEQVHLSVNGALKVRFLGTGAADWTEEHYRGEHRNFSSILVDNHLLIDYTASAKSELPEGCKPVTVFYTHSHADHFNPADALELGIQKVYLSATWADVAKEKFEEASASAGKQMPEIIGVDTLTPYEVDGIIFTPLPANHATSIVKEQALVFLLEKGDARVLYATDTGGIMAIGARHAGFDSHASNKKALTGMIMEATMGLGYDEDYRLFSHSSVNTVLRIAHVLQKTGLYQPKHNEPIYLTHIARTLHAPQSELVNTIPEPLFPAYDGLEVDFA